MRDKGSGWKRLTRGAPSSVWLAAALFVLYKLLPILKLIAVALLVAVVLRILLQWLENLVRVRWVAVLVLIALMGGFGIFLAFVVVPNLLQEAQALLSALPGYINSLIELSKEIRFIPDLSESLGQLRSFISRIVGVLPSLLQQSVEAILKAVAVLILALYIAYDPNFLIKGILRVTPRRQHARTKRLLGSINVRLRGWLVGTGVAMLFVGVGATLGLGIIGIPLFLSLGIIAGLLEIVPYFGSIVGTFLPALVAITISPYKLIIVLILFLILNQIDGNIIQPLAMGQQAHLHPALVVIAFLILGTSLGFIGVLLAVPALAVLLALGEEFTSKPPEEETTINLK
ncbi:MAG: AI-2E family transporter [Cyanobacteria bacterium QS_3_48_167]|nr:MAG: AI-2E family transporter [Cyanobacteria bacterium QS_3_48_167]